jgi:hypothetical protein
MSMAPIPVVPLHVMVLPVVFPIIPAFYDQVMPVGVVLAIVPVVIIMLAVVIDSDLDAGLLGFGFSHVYSYQRPCCLSNAGDFGLSMKSDLGNFLGGLHIVRKASSTLLKVLKVPANWFGQTGWREMQRAQP